MKNIKSKRNSYKLFFNFFFLIFIYCNPIFALENESQSIENNIKINDNWKNILNKASGETIFFHAWGGAKNINSYIKWASKEAMQRYNIKVNHVKISDTSNVVARILSEKTAGKHKNGAVDLIWINGENFSFMQKHKLLFKDNWIMNLPETNNMDFISNPSLLNDFGIPTNGMEMPWGVSQLNFYYDTKYISSPPKSAKELKKYILKNKGRFTFPQPPDFVGTSFLKQILIELTQDKSVLQSKYIEQKHQILLNTLWSWLDEVTPFLWREGKGYPANYSALTQLVADREIDIGIAFEA